MLLDFTVENFRSIKGAETLSAVAASKSKAKPSNSESRRRVKSDDEIAQPFHVEGWDIDVLPVIAIFGANASGKTNILKALDYLLKFMGFVDDDYYELEQLVPFRLTQESIENPSCFKIRIMINSTIYTYSLTLNRVRILSEKLEYALETTKRDRLLFSRNWNEINQKFDWENGSAFARVHKQLQKKLRERESFINLLFKLDIEIVNPLVDWIKYSRAGITWGQTEINTPFFNILFSQEYYLPHRHSDGFDKTLENTKKFLLKFDTGIHDIKISKEDDNSKYQIYALHKTEDAKILSWKFEEEFIGTQKLFSLAYKINLMFQLSLLLIVDELGSNIHPNITSEIIKLFQSLKTNPKRTQLIFTTHDNTLQRNNLLRRDQIWFTQKRPDQSTELYSLSDFKVRNDLAIDKAYLDGRFGAVPFISDEDEEPISLKEKDKDNG